MEGRLAGRMSTIGIQTMKTTAIRTPAAIAYEAHRAACIAKAQALIARLQTPVENPHWGHAGSLEKVRADLDEVLRFVGDPAR